MADGGAPHRGESAATLKEGVDLLKRQQVKLEKSATEEDMERHLEDGQRFAGDGLKLIS